MNRSWIAKFICPMMVGTLVLAAWGSLQASPLVQVILEGRRAGEDSAAWRTSIGGPADPINPAFVASGDRIEYRLRVTMAPVGTSNTQNSPTGPVTTTINSLGTNDGMNSVHVNLRQAASDGIQVDFLRGAKRTVVNPDTGEPEEIDDQLEFLSSTWRNLEGYSGGELATRPGTPYHNLDGVRGQRSGGDFIGDSSIVTWALPPSTVTPENMMVGDAIVMTDGLLGRIMPSWGVGPGTSGGGRVNAGADANSAPFFVTDETQTNSADPLVGFTGLTLVGVPEPSTFVLAGLGLVGLVGVIRRRRAA